MGKSKIHTREARKNNLKGKIQVPFHFHSLLSAKIDVSAQLPPLKIFFKNGLEVQPSLDISQIFLANILQSSSKETSRSIWNC